MDVTGTKEVKTSVFIQHYLRVGRPKGPPIGPPT